MNTNYVFRPFDKSDADYEGMVAVWNACWPHEKTDVAHAKHEDSIREPQHFYECLVYEENGRFVAFGVCAQAWWSKSPGKYFIAVNVLPDYRNRGIGSAYFDQTIARLAEQPDAKMLISDASEDNAAAMRFLEKRGFKQVMRYPLSLLDVQTFQPEQLNGLIEKLESEGVALVSLAHLMETDEAYRRKMYEMECELIKDIPAPDPIKPITYEQFVKRRFEGPNLMPDCYYLAVENGQYVGTSAIWKAAEENKCGTGLTGVMRSHRRRGIASALKAKVIGAAKAKGIQIIQTDNEENNPMFQINLQLGFKPIPALLDYQKEIEAQAE